MFKQTKTHDLLFKVVLTGDTKVGKSKIVTKLIEGTYKQEYISTIGVDFNFQTIQVEDKKVKLHIWDTSGQMRFRNITTAYFPGTHGIVIVYDVSNEKSFHNVRRWLNLVESSANAHTAKLIIGNKTLEQLQPVVVCCEWGQQLAKELGARFFEVDVQSGENIAEAFMILSKDMKTQMETANTTEQAASTDKDVIY